MTIGTLVANLVQDTTTTTGTGAITLTNAVPVGAPAGSTTFASAIAPTGVYPVNNVFYYISDGTNVEAGIGTLTSATNLTRDFVLYSANTPVIAIGNQSGSATHINFAAGTKNVYSNPNLFAQTVALWARVPNQVGGGDGGLTEDLMSGTFTANIVINAVNTPVVVRYKVSSSGICTLTFPQTTANQAGTGVTITGVPAFLCNLFGTINILGQIVVNSVVTIGNYVLAPGATPTTAGVITLQQAAGTAPFSWTSVWTASQPNGVAAGSIVYPLF